MKNKKILSDFNTWLDEESSKNELDLYKVLGKKEKSQEIIFIDSFNIAGSEKNPKAYFQEGDLKEEFEWYVGHYYQEHGWDSWCANHKEGFMLPVEELALALFARTLNNNVDVHDVIDFEVNHDEKTIYIIIEDTFYGLPT